VCCRIHTCVSASDLTSCCDALGKAMDGFTACSKFYQEQTKATGKGDWVLVRAKNRRLMTLLNG
jgi:hypothetical protein